jgi:predicted tellurium resistance membrane protein TerC
VILGFIGLKLVLEALHGSHIDVPEIGVGPSLGFILGVLLGAVVAAPPPTAARTPPRRLPGWLPTARRAPW